MKVREALGLLAQCDPEAELVVNTPFGGGYQPVNVIVRWRGLGGVAHRLSMDTIDAVEPVWADFAHMRGQGYDVIGPESPRPCDCRRCVTRAECSPEDNE